MAWQLDVDAEVEHIVAEARAAARAQVQAAWEEERALVAADQHLSPVEQQLRVWQRMEARTAADQAAWQQTQADMEANQARLRQAQADLAGWARLFAPAMPPRRSG